MSVFPVGSLLPADGTSPRFRPCRPALSLALLLAAAGPARAQVPDLTVECLARSIFNQTGASTLVEREAHFQVLQYSSQTGLTFSGTLFVNGTPYPLTGALAMWEPWAGLMERPGLERRFANSAALEAVFPPRTAAMVQYVSNRGDLTTNVILPYARPASPVAPILNFDALQAWEGGPLTVTWRELGILPEDAEVEPEVRIYYTNSSTWTQLSLHRAPSIDTVDVSNRIIYVQLGQKTFTFSNVSAEPGETLYGQLRHVGNPRWIVRFPIRRVALAPPVISTPPQPLTVRVGEDATFSVTATGTNLTYQWQKDGTSLPGATGATLTLRAVQPAQAGNYAVLVRSNGGELLSPPVALIVVVPPAVTREPASQTVVAGAPVSLAVTATGTALTYQWQRNGENIPGATQATFSLAAARPADAGRYRVTITNLAGTIRSAEVELDVAPVTRLANLSVRTRIGDEQAPLTVGLTVSGGTAGGTKPLLLRAVGPSLAAFGVGDAARAVQLALLRGAETMAANDGWRGQTTLATAAAAVGAFAFADSASLDAALLPSVVSAGYTVRITASAPGGTALAEIYDASPGDTFSTATPRLTNLSVLTQVGGGADVLIAGFTVAGRNPQRLLLRAVGPALTAFGVADFLADPRLELHRAGTATAIAANDDWGSTTAADAVARASADVGAFALPPAGRDAALLVTLPPGSYTAQVSGPGEARGTALVEVYEVP